MKIKKVRLQNPVEGKSKEEREEREEIVGMGGSGKKVSQMFEHLLPAHPLPKTSSITLSFLHFSLI